jgi:hypothetical protein
MTCALSPHQAADARRHVDAAIGELRQLLGVVESCGPALVASYRALGAAFELREVLDRLPIVVDRECGCPARLLRP